MTMQYNELQGLSQKWKNLHWSILGKNYCILGRIWASTGFAEQIWFIPNTIRGSGRLDNPRQSSKFFPTFELGSSISSTWTDTKLLYNYEYVFPWKLAINHDLSPSLSLSLALSVSLSPTNILRLKDYPHNLTKYMKPRVLQNSQFPKSLVNLEKFGSKT